MADQGVENGSATSQAMPSEAAWAQAQEQSNRGVSSETNQVTTSETKPGSVQEQPTTEQGKPQPDEAEIRRRIEQSERDKIRHEERMRVEMEMRRQREEEERRRKLEEEQERIRAMDDEELGQYIRKQQAEQLQRQQIMQQISVQQVGQFIAEALSTITDPTARATLEQRLARNEFATPAAFIDAVANVRVEQAKAEAEKRIAAEVAKAQKEARDAVRKEITAETVENDAGPVTGSGMPTSHIGRMNSKQLISIGWQEEVEKLRGR